MIPENIKKEIDNMNYYELLKKWRFAPSGDPILSGEIGEYFSDKMTSKKYEEKDPMKISDLVGWCLEV